MSKNKMSHEEMIRFVIKVIDDLHGRPMTDGVRVVGFLAFKLLCQIPDKERRLKHGATMLDGIKLAMESSLEEEPKEEKVYV